MSLRNGVDTVSVLSLGVYSETYTSVGDPDKLASLFASLGLFESAAGVVPAPFTRRIRWYLLVIKSLLRR